MTQPLARARVKRPPVQILVVLANIQMRTLKTECKSIVEFGYSGERLKEVLYSIFVNLFTALPTLTVLARDILLLTLFIVTLFIVNSWVSRDVIISLEVNTKSMHSHRGEIVFHCMC